MPRTITLHRRPLPRTYAGLVALFTPRPINDRIGLATTRGMVDRLAVEPLNTEQAEYLELLTTVIEKYESEHEAIDTSAGDPIDTLKYLMNGRQMNASDLGRLLGNRSLGAKILKGERELSKLHIAKLSVHFRVSPSAFFKLRPEPAPSVSRARIRARAGRA